jgi:RNA 2',3'-cyclic 3'-phosphodiesterase
MPRLFVAVYPPAEVIDALAALPRELTSGVRWIPPEQYHVTIRFLGDAEAEPVIAALDEVVPTLPRSAVVLGPQVSRLGRNVVCVPATGLDVVAGGIAGATAHFGIPPDPRPFRGHVTLARLRRRAACGLAGTAFDVTFEAGGVHLVESITRSEGAEHSLVCSWQLSA